MLDASNQPVAEPDVDGGVAQEGTALQEARTIPFWLSKLSRRLDFASLPGRACKGAREAEGFLELAWVGTLLDKMSMIVMRNYETMCIGYRPCRWSWTLFRRITLGM